MKKIILGIIIVLTFILGSINVLAKEQKIEFSFKVGSNTVTINSKDVKVEKPYIQNKATMLPISVIVDAFGADMINDTQKNTVTLNYSGVEIKFTLKSKTVYVNGIKSTLLAMPEIKTKTIMVPLEFICDNYGAEITKDKKTALITVTKEISGENSIKDFGLILKKTTKGEIGDSYYKWSINHPKDLKMSYREFAGDYTKFAAVDKSYSLYLTINKQKDETIDSVMSSELDAAKDYTLISQSKETKNSMEYIKTVYQSSEDKIVSENRVYINNGYIYYLDLEVAGLKDYNNSSKYKVLMDSFDTNYIQNNLIEDLSDVDKNNLRTYESKILKWSVKVPADFIKSSADQKTNKIIFYDANDRMTNITIDMYSIENGLTLNSWVEHDVKKIQYYFDPKLAQVLKVEDGTYNNIKIKTLYSKFKIKDKDYYTYDKYILGKKYRYDVSYVIPADIYNDNNKKEKYDNIIESFKFTDPKIDEVGQLTDANMFPEATGKRTISNKDFKWSFELPVSWISVASNAGGNTAQYYNKDNSIRLIIGAIKDKSAEEFKTYYEDTLVKQAAATESFEIKSKETLTEKGTTIYKYVNALKTENADLTEFYYIFSKNNNLYTISFMISDIVYGPKNEQMIKEIWDSMKFE